MNLKVIEELEAQRKSLRKNKDFKYLKILLWVATYLVAIPFFNSSSSLLLLFIIGFPLISFFYYQYAHELKVGPSKHEQLKTKFFNFLLKDFMSKYHPKIKAEYISNNKFKTSKLNDLFSGMDFYNFESYKLSYDNIIIEFSESDIKNPYESKTTFKGNTILINLIDGRFPQTVIESKAHEIHTGLFNDSRKEFQNIKNTRLRYVTSNPTLFEEKILPLIPLFDELSEKLGGIKIVFLTKRVIIFVKGSTLSLDNPKLSSEDSFHNKSIAENLARKINTILFIADSFNDGVERTEVEERLELKMLEYIKPIQGNDFDTYQNI